MITRSNPSRMVSAIPSGEADRLAPGESGGSPAFRRSVTSGVAAIARPPVAGRSLHPPGGNVALRVLPGDDGALPPHEDALGAVVLHAHQVATVHGPSGDPTAVRPAASRDNGVCVPTAARRRSRWRWARRP